ncbi:MAG TPA: SUMF1/EgtB/PvdO family nonheme iron enzyme [Polyangiaceae bacterium]
MVPRSSLALLGVFGIAACRAKGGGPAPAPMAGEGGPADAAEAPRDAATAFLEVEAGPEEEDAGELEAGIGRRCPKDMVDVAGRLCIDRYEDSLVDDATGERLSPHYPPEPGVPLRIFARWDEERLATGPPSARAMPLPAIPDVERGESFRPRSVSLRGVLPQGYVNGRVAAEACERAKKRLCTHEEWQFACRGERQTKYPYGGEYRAGVCNVYRAAHPAQLLHENASLGHSDPRLGLVQAEDGPLLRPTGSTKECKSRWGKDAIYDMVGNEDEWIDDPEGTFVGGFFSRGTKEGCDSIVTVHPISHWDYSIGFRCCR